MLGFPVPHSVKENASARTESIPAHLHCRQNFLPQNALFLRSLWTAFRLLYMTTDISRCLSNVSLVIILSCFFSVVYRFPVLCLYTFFRCDKLVVDLLAHNRRWIPLGFITTEITMQLPRVGLITSAKFAMQWPLAGLITSVKFNMQWPWAG